MHFDDSIYSNREEILKFLKEDTIQKSSSIYEDFEITESTNYFRELRKEPSLF